MTAFNIMPWHEDGQVAPGIVWGPMASGETFQIGEPIYVNSSGQLKECADDATQVGFGGIAMGPVYYTRGTAYAAGSASTKNWESGAAYAALDFVPYIRAIPGRLFISSFLSNGASCLMAPAGSTISSSGTTYAKATAITKVGAVCGLQVTSGEWQFDLGMTTDTSDTFRIVRFLDSNKIDISRSGQPASWVIATCIQSQWMPISDAAGNLAAIG